MEKGDSGGSHNMLKRWSGQWWVGVGESGFELGGGGLVKGRGQKQDLRTMSKSHTH